MLSTAYAGGATDKSVYVRGFTASTGLPYTAGAFDTASIAARYRRAGANAEVTITPVTQTVSGAHTDGGFVHVSGGVYRLDIPDAAIAASSDYVDVWVYGITDVVFSTAHIDIVGSDPRAAAVAANVTQIAGQTASASGTVTFPNATLASTTNITAGTITTATNVTTVNGLAANVITAASINADAITSAKIATDAITSAQLAASAVTEIQSGLATAAALTTVDNEIATLQTTANNI
jgi:hypothetical protein